MKNLGLGFRVRFRGNYFADCNADFIAISKIISNADLIMTIEPNADIAMLTC
jgi:hypothetical protein